MKFDKKNLSEAELMLLYRALLKPRVIEERMLVLLRQGKIGKWFSGIGQEAISVGVAMALNTDEYILPLHRNLGIFTTRNMTDAQLFAQWQGKESGFTKGRDRSFHFGSNEHHIVGMISHLGAMLGVANGIALADLIENKKNVTLCFSGDGGTSEGDFHEALNVAAVWSLPVIFLIENNGYGLSTPSNDQFRCKQFIDKGIGYGMETLQIDGNNILEVYHAISDIAESMRQNPRPILVEALTFRMRGHEEASGTKYVPHELFDQWAPKDPLKNYENFLFSEGYLTDELKQSIESEILKSLNLAIEKVFEEPEIVANVQTELNDVYAPFEMPEQQIDTTKTQEIRLIDAVRNALWMAMEKHDNLVIMGQDVAEYGGVFKATDGFLEKFGKQRVRNTPITESSILGAGYGLAIRKHKAIVEMQFSDFVTCGFNQIVNNLAKSYYRWNQPADVVVRMPTGAGVQAGPFHSQSTEAWFYHIPGLKIYYPSTAKDAKGLLLRAIEDPNPVLFFEHKYLYRTQADLVPEDYYLIDEGQAVVHDFGSDACIITYGWGVQNALKVVQENNFKVTIIDLRTLAPLDKSTIEAVVKSTGKVLVLTEDCITGSIASDISSWISEEFFVYLDAPVMRLGSLDTPIPLAKTLEDEFLPWGRLKGKLEKLIEY
jgi:2-oxoisovalerate dehydrogenase E1 component